MPEQDHYEVLDLTPSASDAEIKRRYRALMRKIHPDANASPDANRQAARVNRAYETLGDPERRRAYDVSIRARTRVAAGSGRSESWQERRAADRRYAAWAAEPDWEEIVAEHVPQRRPAHIHAPMPTFDPPEIEVSMSDLRVQPRIRRTITVTNNCGCTIRGDVSTSEPWVWGPIGRLEVGPGQSVSFDIEVIARKVSFPGLSRVTFVSKDWTASVPVKVTGYEPKQRRMPPATDMPYVRQRRQKWAKYR